MSMKRARLAKVAETLSQKPFHGNVKGAKQNLTKIIAHFGPCSFLEWDGKWCAAFVYHCCIVAGLALPVRYPGTTCNFAGVLAWLQWAKQPGHRFYRPRRNGDFSPKRGDLVIYNNVTSGPHDHMGVLLSARNGELVVAEGNLNNVSSIVQRPVDSHVRGYIRIPEAYRRPDR